MPLSENNIHNSIKIFNSKGYIIPWDYNFFPDGQVQVKIKSEYFNDDALMELKVFASIYNSIILDLFFQIIDNFNVVNVKINYLYGARCDKNKSGDYFVANVASNIVDKIENWWYNNNTKKINYLAPHCYELCKSGKVNFDLPDCVNLDDYDLVIYPDKSAQKRYIKVDKPYIICEKHRDQETGKILSHVIPNLPDGVTRVLILDDLCDYGTTFKNVGEIIPDGIEADLFIFHGVFTENAPLRLFKYYKNIFVSNSLPYIDEMANILNQWKNNTINYKQACEQLGVKDLLQYENINLGNLIVFDIWSK